RRRSIGDGSDRIGTRIRPLVRGRARSLAARLFHARERCFEPFTPSATDPHVDTYRGEDPGPFGKARVAHEFGILVGRRTRFIAADIPANVRGPRPKAAR